MATPCSPDPIGIGHSRTELALTGALSLGGSDIRAFTGKATGPVRLFDTYCLSDVFPLIVSWNVSSSTAVRLPMTGVNVSVTWGDGSPQETFTSDMPSHTYSSSGVFQIKVSGLVSSWDMSLLPAFEAYKLQSVDAWGDAGVFVADSYLNGFKGAKELTAVNSADLLITAGSSSYRDMFNNCELLTGVDMTNWDTSACTDMFNMFSFCVEITDIQMAGLDTSNVTNMSAMFTYCMKMTNLLQSGLDTSKVTDFGFMFNWCIVLPTIDTSWMNFSSATVIWSMFADCNAATSINVSSLTKAVVSYKNMFINCWSLTTLDVSAFDTSIVDSFDYMIYGCSALTEIVGLNTFDVRTLRTADAMLTNTPMSTARYDELLISWASQGALQSSVPFENSSKYSPAALSSRNILTGTYGWIILDGGPV